MSDVNIIPVKKEFAAKIIQWHPFLITELLNIF